MSSALSKALAASRSKSQMKRVIAQEGPEGSDAYKDAVGELYDAIKAEDSEAFEEVLKAVIQIVSSEEQE